MKKLKLSKLNLATNDLLQREQLKTVFGGYNGNGSSHPDGCKVYWRDKDGNGLGWSEGTISYSSASNYYQTSYTSSNGNYVSGYCCSSCP